MCDDYVSLNAAAQSKMSVKIINMKLHERFIEIYQYTTGRRPKAINTASKSQITHKSVALVIDLLAA